MKTQKEIEMKLQAVVEKCDMLLKEIELLRKEYVHNDMTSLLNAARECSEREIHCLRIVRNKL